MQPLFSVVLIARNEEKTLPRLIASLSEFQKRGGEILVCDTGSTDNTAQVAEDLGCIVYRVGDKFVTIIDEEKAKELNTHFIENEEQPIVKVGDRLFDFASARNYIADFANTDVIATPDCDEIYTKFDIDGINSAIAAGADQLEYNFVFSHDEFGNEAIKFMHCKFYNRKKLKWQGVVHEILVGTANRIYLPENIIKLEHFQNPETNRSGYLRGLALDCFLNPHNDRNSHYLGRELLWTGRPHSAIKELKRHVAMNAWQAERAQSMIYIGDALIMLGKDEEALEWYHRAFLTESARREALIRLGEYFYRRGDAQKVASYMAGALEIPETGFYANNLDHYTHYPHELMYWAQWQLGRQQESKKHFDLAFNFKPHHGKFLHDYRFYYRLPNVTFVIPTLGREEGLKACIDSIKALNYPQEKIEIIIKEDSFEKRTGVPKLLKQGIEESTGEWIVYASNDVIFTPNSLIEGYLQAKSTGFTAFNTGYVGPDEGNICEHFMIRKDVIAEIGEVFDTDFHHIGVDNLLWAKMKKLEKAQRADYAQVIHNHFSQNPGRKGKEMDEVYKLGYENQEVDRILLKKKLKELDTM